MSPGLIKSQIRPLWWHSGGAPVQEEMAKIRLLLYVISRWLQVKTSTEGSVRRAQRMRTWRRLPFDQFFFFWWIIHWVKGIKNGWRWDGKKEKLILDNISSVIWSSRKSLSIEQKWISAGIKKNVWELNNVCILSWFIFPLAGPPWSPTTCNSHTYLTKVGVAAGQISNCDGIHLFLKVINKTCSNFETRRPRRMIQGRFAAVSSACLSPFVLSTQRQVDYCCYSAQQLQNNRAVGWHSLWSRTFKGHPAQLMAKARFVKKLQR